MLNGEEFHSSGAVTEKAQSLFPLSQEQGSDKRD